MGHYREMRLVLFTDGNNATTAALVRETVRLSREGGDVRLCGIVTSRPDAFRSRRSRDAWRRVRRAAVAVANNEEYRGAFERSRVDLFRLARSLDIPVLVPPGRDPNTPDFVAQLRERTAADAALSVYFGVIWKSALLGAFDQAVNYHDSLLPRYRGIGATSFSIYDGEPESGFTFHRMDAGIDTGPILVQGAVGLDGRSTLAGVGRQKAHAAAAALPRVFARMTTGDPGETQTGAGSSYTRRDFLAMTRISQPQLLTAAELSRRIRAFGVVELDIAGATWPVTRFRIGRSGRLSFASADEAHCVADRVHGLPVRLARRPASR